MKVELNTLDDSASKYETYILTRNIEYLPDYSTGMHDSGYDEDEDSASNLLKIETVFIIRCPKSYKSEQLIECTAFTLHNENWDFEPQENWNVSCDSVERYPFEPPVELLALNNLSLQDFSMNSELTCWSIHWYVSGQFDVEKDFLLDGWYLDFYLQDDGQVTETEWRNLVWPESILTKIQSYRSSDFTIYPFAFNKKDFHARIKIGSILSKKVAPLHPDDIARLNCEALSQLLNSSNESSIDSLRNQLVAINSGATQGWLVMKPAFDA